MTYETVKDETASEEADETAQEEALELSDFKDNMKQAAAHREPQSDARVVAVKMHTERGNVHLEQFTALPKFVFNHHVVAMTIRWALPQSTRHSFSQVERHARKSL